jgi:hypothetical protein
MRDGLAPAIRVEILVLVESPPDEHQLRVHETVPSRA